MHKVRDRVRKVQTTSGKRNRWSGCRSKHRQYYCSQRAVWNRFFKSPSIHKRKHWPDLLGRKGRRLPDHLYLGMEVHLHADQSPLPAPNKYAFNKPPVPWGRPSRFQALRTIHFLSRRKSRADTHSPDVSWDLTIENTGHLRGISHVMVDRTELYRPCPVHQWRKDTYNATSRGQHRALLPIRFSWLGVHSYWVGAFATWSFYRGTIFHDRLDIDNTLICMGRFFAV